MQTQCNIRKKKYFDCVRTIRPSVTMYTFVYYYTDVCDLTLIGIFFFYT